MIAVLGEALIDLIVGPAGTVNASLGGGPFNVARTIARLGGQSVFVGRLSADGFGAMLRAALDKDDVAVAVPALTQAPTTLAVVDVDERGVPRFRFHLAGTSAAELDRGTLASALPSGTTAVHIGSLGLVMDPAADAIASFLEQDVPPGVLVMADPNCRAEAIGDHDRYRARLAGVLRRADVVKVSAEDLGYLRPGMAPMPAARSLLPDTHPSLVLITEGARPARALTSATEIEVPVPRVKVADTIGAGDAFGGAFVSWWTGHGLGVADLADPATIREALEFAVRVSALTCTRYGADPPRLAAVQRS